MDMLHYFYFILLEKINTAIYFCNITLTLSTLNDYEGL